jgi:hypothetical protein
MSFNVRNQNVFSFSDLVSNLKLVDPIAIGWQPDKTNQGAYSIAIGSESGTINQGTFAVAIGYKAAQYNQGSNAIALGKNAGQTSQGSETIAIGDTAGQYQQKDFALALGTNAGQNNQGTSAIAIGSNAAYLNQSNNAIAIGTLSGFNSQRVNAIALGNSAGQNNQGSGAISIGMTSGQTNQGLGAIALGNSAGQNNQGSGAISIGMTSGQTNQGLGAIALGENAGNLNQGLNAIAIGKNAGYSNQHNNSIILNASGDVLNSTTNNGFYVSPINTAIKSKVLYYNTENKEITYGGAPGQQFYYLDFMNTIMYPTEQTGAQVTNTLTPASGIPTPPPQPIVVVPGSFNFTVGSGGSFPDLQTALASASVTDGMNLQMLAGTYTIPDVGITISKQVGLWGVGANSVVLQTNATGTAPVTAINITVPNVTLYGMTLRHRRTTNISVETCIRFAGAGNSGLSGIVIASCTIEFMEFGIIAYGDGFQIRDSTLSYTSGTNTTRRCIGVYRSTGNSFITGNTILNNNASGNLRFIQITSAAGINEIVSGTLVVRNNVQDIHSGLHQFFNQDSFASTGNNTFTLYFDQNNTNETSAFVVLVSGTNSGNIFNQIVLVNNTCSNIHGKGILAVDGTGAFRSIGSLPVVVAKDVVANTAWLGTFAPAPGSMANYVGYNAATTSSVNVSLSVVDGLAVVSSILAEVPIGTWNLEVYASSPSGSVLSYSFGYTNANGYGGSQFQVLNSGTITIDSTTIQSYPISFSTPFNTQPIYNPLRLRFEVGLVGSTGSIVLYSRDLTNSIIQSPSVNNSAWTLTGSRFISNVPLNFSTTNVVLFPRVLFSAPPKIVCSANALTGSAAANADSVLCSVESVSTTSFTLRLRNLNTTSDASIFNVNFTAQQ